GPNGGAVPFACRYHIFNVTVRPGQTPPVAVEVIETHLLTDERGRQLVGASAAFENGLRFDPEAVRVSKTGSLLVADEYGPSVCEFAADGKRLRCLKVPEHVRIAVPGATADREEPPHNARGRVHNHGFEGLTFNPDRTKLLALLQGPLLQDGGREGVCIRILEFDLASGATREKPYLLDSPQHGAHEVLAVNDHVVLVIENDGEGGAAARFKKVMRVNLAEASDIGALASLPPRGLPQSVKAAVKEPLIDLLDPRYGLAGESFPAKVEGLAFGPDLPDGRKLLLVTTDNDFTAETPTWVWAFAVDPADLTAPWRALRPILPPAPPDETVSPFALPMMLLGVIALCLLGMIVAWRWVGGGRNRLVSQRRKQ
ncbi:MAG: esterase-like activity of phytase family protein, partial [Gemmataceae bacterium]|nr:esterase-like activity of phytase family protein [Gemmataceae bacterium]